MGPGAIVPFVAPTVGAGKRAAALKGLGYLTTGLSGAALLGGTGLGLYDVYKQFTDKDKLIGDFTDIEENVDGIRKLNPYQSLRRISIDALNPDVNIDNNYIQDQTDILAAKREARQQELALKAAKSAAAIKEEDPEYKLLKAAQESKNLLAQGRLGLDQDRLGLERQIAQGDIYARNQKALSDFELQKLGLGLKGSELENSFTRSMAELELLKQRDQREYDKYVLDQKRQDERDKQRRMDLILLALQGLTMPDGARMYYG